MQNWGVVNDKKNRKHSHSRNYETCEPLFQTRWGSRSSHVLHLPPQMISCVFLTKRQETSAGFWQSITSMGCELGLVEFWLWFLTGQDPQYRFPSPERVCRDKVLERPCALRNTVLSSISTHGTGHRDTEGILHNWRTRFTPCWPQCLYKKDLHDWLEEKNNCTLHIGEIV